MPAAKRLNSTAYARFDSRLLGVWAASRNAGTDAAAIGRAALCSAADAWRVSVIRQSASPALIQLWLDGELSVRQLFRICLDAPLFEPHEEREQLELAAHHSHRARLMLESA